jgi:hypothetical protein
MNKKLPKKPNELRKVLENNREEIMTFLSEMLQRNNI